MKKIASIDEDQLLTRLLINKIGPVDMELVIGADRMPSGEYIVKLNGKRVTDNEALALRREAELVEQTRLWQTLTETLRYQAQRMMFEESKEAPDVFVKGKFLLHAISTLEHIVWSAKNPKLIADEKVINTSARKRVDKRSSING